MGRGKVELKRIENPSSRQVTFSKRRNGLLKKAFELSILCDAEVALLVFSPSGKAYQFSSHEMDRTIARYRSQVGLNSQSNNEGLRTMKIWRTEMEELKRTIETLEAKQKHLVGEDLSMLGMKELKKLERQLRTGFERVQSGKRRVLSQHINFMKKRQRALQEENTNLQKRIKLHELHEAEGRSGIVGPSTTPLYSKDNL